MAKRYGLFNEANGAPKRAIVIVDKSGIIKFREEYPPGVLPSPEDILSELIRIG
jgi:alkyl hydroperoxide reductase subunit AhpC